MTLRIIGQFVLDGRLATFKAFRMYRRWSGGDTQYLRKLFGEVEHAQTFATTRLMRSYHRRNLLKLEAKND